MNTASHHRKKLTIIRPDARKREPLPADEVEIRAPKTAEKAPSKPNIINLVSPALFAIVIGIGMASSTGLRLYYLMPIVGLLPGVLQLWKHRSDLKKHEQAEEERKQHYQTYLREKEDELIAYNEEQQRILWQENPSTTEMTKRADRGSSHLWQRLPGDDDFLATRIGSSDLPASITIKVPDKDPDEDPLIADALHLRRKYSTVPGLPITVNLYTLGTIGVRGRGRDVSLQLVFTLIANLVSHHSPDVLQLYVISHRPGAAREWQWARWLPHTGVLHSREDKTAALSFDAETADEVLTTISNLLRRRLDNQQRTSSYGEAEPHLLIVFDQLEDLRQHKSISMLLAHKPGSREGNALQASAIFVDRLPPQVNGLIEVQGTSLEYWETWSASANQKNVAGEAELTSAARMDKLARALAPLRTAASNKAGGGSLPSSVRLVELLGATQPPEVDLSLLYSDNYSPNKVMDFPIGLNVDLKPLHVILREDSRGGYAPHAMLAGGTGKGKSITLQSIVLSLAATNSPQHLNFVLADFKAGSSELARLKDLPHVVGFVTDLDEAYVERFRQSLTGEVRRRKRVLEDTPTTLGRQITNIYDYNIAVSENLIPHLVVVIDEFAKALQINPAFKTTLDKDIAAQGRALGIHLILSTQKPNDFADFRANVEVRMSMQVQTTDDSRVIFNRDEAARKLTRAGQAYLQVGDNRIFEMFQVARTDVPYKPEGAGSMDLVDDFKIRQLLPNGGYQTIYNHIAPRQPQVQNGRSALSEAEVLVDHIRNYCESRYPKPHIICLPPLPSAPQLPLFPMLAQYPAYGRWQAGSGWTTVQQPRDYRLHVPLGMLDLPAAQEQRPYFFNLNERDGNLIIVGATGSGKNLLLRTLVLALVATHNPDDLLFYFLSRSATLSVFEELPHCQAFIQPMETERIMRLFLFLEQEIARRVELMRSARAESINALRLARPDLALPSLILVFDDFAGFIADHFDRLRDVESLAANARQVDLHLVLSVTAMSSIHPKIQQNMQNRIALGLSNTLDVFSQRAKPLPHLLGRGYVLEDQEIVEIQIAAPVRQAGLELHTVEAVAEVRDMVAAMKSEWVWAKGQRPLPLIGQLGKYIQLESLWQSDYRRPTWYEQPTAPIGKDYNLEVAWVEFNVLEAYNLVIGPAKSGKTDFLLALALATAQNFAPEQVEIVVFAMTTRSTLHHLSALPQVKLARNPRTAKEILTALQAELKERAIQQKEAMERTATGTLALTAYLPLRTLILVDDVQQFSRDNGLNQLLDQCMEESGNSQVYLFLADSGNNMTQVKQNFNIKYIQNAARYGSGITFSADASDLSLLQLMGRIKTPELKLHSPHIGEGRGFWAYQGQVKVVQIGHVGRATDAIGEYETAVQQLIQTIASKYQVEE